MGRKTFESIGKPLKDRRNIVISRDKTLKIEGIEVVNSLDDAVCRTKDENEIFIIGGEQIYRMTLAVADRIYLTEVDADIKGDAFFPEFDKSAWSQVKVEHPEGMASPAYRFLVLERI